MRIVRYAATSTILLSLVTMGADSAWFRGPDGMGTAVDVALPDHWSATENCVWKTPLPGPGGSSPIVVGDRVFLTYYSGYAVSPDEPGAIESLARHLICVNLSDGKVVWDKGVEAVQPEKPYDSFTKLHGYASSTPASDGSAVYAFFGRSGVYAYNLSGEPLWHASVGTGTHEWGSATSPIVFEKLVIVNASVESNSVVALDKASGKEVWRVDGVSQSWSTPAVVDLPGDKHELVVSLQGKVFGLDPATGERLWECTGVQDYVCPSVLVHDDVVFVTAGRQPATVAIRAGGAGT